MVDADSTEIPDISSNNTNEDASLYFVYLSNHYLRLVVKTSSLFKLCPNTQ
jgi:hypothetical protein